MYFSGQAGETSLGWTEEAWEREKLWLSGAVREMVVINMSSGYDHKEV